MGNSAERPTVPAGFEGLTPGALGNIRDYAGARDLEEFGIRDLISLRKRLSSDASLLYCIPDHGAMIMHALTARIEILRDSMRQAGSELAGLDENDVEANLGLIRDAFDGSCISR